MGARMSAAMALAKKLVLEDGYTTYRAAKEAGITQSAIAKSDWRRKQLAEQRERGEGAHDTSRLQAIQEYWRRRRAG